METYKALLLDRDGVILRERGDYNYLEQHLHFPVGIVEALTELKRRGYRFFVITNQGGIAKGRYKHNQVRVMHKMIREFFSADGINIEEFYYCPHHNDYGKCLCRKPNSLMLEKAVARYKLDKTRSYMIGDAERDIQAAERIGIKGIRITANDDLRKYLDLMQ